MNEGLEALQEMCDEAISSICRYIPRQAHEEVTGYFDKRKTIIEKELKELEERREMMKRFNEASVPSVIDDDTYKKVKALDVIKPYINDLIGCNVYDRDFVEYFIETKHGRKFISKEEYDSLKEELL